MLSVRFDPSDSNVAVIAIGAGAPSFTTGNLDALDFYEGGMFVTVNRGESWERVPVGDSELISNFSSIVMNPGEPSSLTAFGLHTSPGGDLDTSLNPGFWRSNDGGQNWEAFGPADINGSEVSHFTVSSDGRVIYASVADTYRHWISLDGGGSWVATSINQGGGPVAVSPADSNIVIFRNSHQTSLFRSTDGLRTYNEVVTTEGASTASGERFAFEDIVFAPSDPSRVYAATTGLRVYRSDDGGATFTLMKNIRSEVLNGIP